MLLGRQRPRRWTGWLRETVAQQLLRKATQFELTIVSPEDEDARKDIISGGFRAAFGEWNAYALATLCVGLAATLAYGVSLAAVAERVAYLHDGRHSHSDLYRPWPSFLASVLSFFAYNIFFTKPYYNFSGFDATRDLLTIVFFLLVSFVVGNLAARLKVQIQAHARFGAAHREPLRIQPQDRRCRRIGRRALGGGASCRLDLAIDSLVLLPQKDGRLQIAAGYPPEDQLALKDWGAAEWAWEHGSPAGWKSETLPAADWLFLPMRTGRGMVGLLGVSFENASARWRRISGGSWKRWSIRSRSRSSAPISPPTSKRRGC